MKDVRPTSSRILLALMSILESRGKLRGAAFLDLFAGTGRVGMEALNRGADTVYFVEALRDRAAGIERAARAHDGDRCVVLALELRRALNWLVKRGCVFDVIFADPPYNDGWNESLIPCIEKNNSILKGDGIFVYEHSAREAVQRSSWSLTESRSYGESALTFFSKEIIS